MDPEDLQNSSFCKKTQSETSIDQYSLISYNSIDQYPDNGRSVDSSSRKNSIVIINSHDINKEPTKQVNSIGKWIDSIYDLFQEPESNSVVMSEDKLLNDNISYEESEVQIIALASILALSLLLIASTMLGLLVANSSSIVIIWNYDPPVSKPKSRTPHVALLFFDGRMNIYELNSSNQHLEFRWNITIRTPKNDGQYFSFQEQDPIHVFYGDMQKVITIIQSETDYKNKKMRNILSNETFQKSGYFRVGNYLWIFGGYINMKEHWEWIGDPRKTMVWQIQKQRWIWGPDIPFYDPELENNLWHKPFIHQGSTGFSRSQNVGVIIFFNQALSKQGCMVAMAFDFSIQRWTKIDKCFYLLDNVPIQAISLASGIHTTSKILLRSASYFNKSAELKVILWFMIEDKSIGEYTQGVLEFDSNLNNIQLHLLKRSNEIDEVEGTLFSSRSMIYLITGSYDSFQLTVHIWKNSSMDAIQFIETTHETKPKGDNIYQMRHNFMVSTSWIY